MPYKIAQRGGKYCVVKISDGTSLGCHATKKQAQKQLVAILISEKNKGVARIMTIEEFEALKRG